jgi:hypothetical protein
MMIRGIPIEMGGSEWIVPPLTVRQVRDLKPERDQVGQEGISDEELMPVACRIVLAALQRNYPDVTADRLDDLIDMGNFREVLLAVLTGSGLKPAVSGEAAAARTGSASTGSSPQPPDTDPETSTS